MADLSQQADLQTQAARALIDGTREYPWETLVCDFRSVGSFGEVDVTVSGPTLPSERIAPPSGLVSTMAKLRKAMATAEHGAWFAATITLRRADGSVDLNVKYNYDDRPAWNLEPDDEAYREDLQRYPRPANEVPAWHPAGRV